VFGRRTLGSKSKNVRGKYKSGTFEQGKKSITSTVPKRILEETARGSRATRGQEHQFLEAGQPHCDRRSKKAREKKLTQVPGYRNHLLHTQREREKVCDNHLVEEREEWEGCQGTQ